MQSRKMSALEITINYIIGFLVAMWIQRVGLGWIGFSINLEQNLILTSVFTIVSIIRSYIIRRVFNYYATNKNNPSH